MRASGASELRKCWHFYILKLPFLSIFCRYITYFVGTNDMLVGLHVPTNFQMYRQKSEKALLGGGGGGWGQFPCPPLPTLVCTGPHIHQDNRSTRTGCCFQTNTCNKSYSTCPQGNSYCLMHPLHKLNKIILI